MKSHKIERAIQINEKELPSIEDVKFLVRNGQTLDAEKALDKIQKGIRDIQDDANVINALLNRRG